MTESRPSRAKPLSPDERRRSIVAAVVPLLVREGPTVTTRQMAEAAGVAEGTLFRVFPDKHSLIGHALKHVMDPAPLRRALSEIYEGAPFEVQLAEAARILIERSDEVFALFSVARSLHAGAHRPPTKMPSFIGDFHRGVIEALTELFERNRDALRVEPAIAARVFRGLISAGATFPDREKMTVQEIVDAVLFGVAQPQARVP